MNVEPNCREKLIWTDMKFSRPCGTIFAIRWFSRRLFSPLGTFFSMAHGAQQSCTLQNRNDAVLWASKSVPQRLKPLGAYAVLRHG
jgi:hypothetical protein